MAQGYAIQLRNVKKQFGDHVVLRDVNLDIADGEFIAIVGKSGCGKSTLLRLIADLDDVTEGEVSLSDHDGPACQSDVKVLFQEARLLPWKPVWKNVALVTQDKEKEGAVEALRKVKLEDKADVWPETLSGGQKQRVSLARALSSDPKVLLLDEPLGALDALTRIEMQMLIEDLWSRQGFTALLVTHDVSEAVYLADRVVLIDDGRITMDESIDLARPRVRNADFAYYEERILRRVLHERAQTMEEEQNRNESYAI